MMRIGSNLYGVIIYWTGKVPGPYSKNRQAGFVSLELAFALTTLVLANFVVGFAHGHSTRYQSATAEISPVAMVSLADLLDKEIDADHGHNERQSFKNAWRLVEIPRVPELAPYQPSASDPPVVLRLRRVGGLLSILAGAFLSLATFANWRVQSFRLRFSALVVATALIWSGLHLGLQS